MNYFEKMKAYAPAVVRTGMALVFLWFGSQQLMNTEAWTGLIPSWALSLSGLAAAQIVFLNGIFEVIFGSALLLGLFTRIAALLLGLHLFGIALTMGYTGIGVRDFGLTLATLSVFLNGVDKLCLDKFLKQSLWTR